MLNGRAVSLQRVEPQVTRMVEIPSANRTEFDVRYICTRRRARVGLRPGDAARQSERDVLGYDAWQGPAAVARQIYRDGRKPVSTPHLVNHRAVRVICRIKDRTTPFDWIRHPEFIVRTHHTAVDRGSTRIGVPASNVTVSDTHWKLRP